VLDPGLDFGKDGPKPVVLTADRQVVRLSLLDFPVPVEPQAWMRVPKTFSAKSAQSRRDLAAALRSKAADAGVRAERPRRQRADAADDTEIARLRAAIRRHPCHGCDDRENHARWAERYWRLERETEQLERRVLGRTNSIARTFDRVCSVLTVLGYLDGEQVTEPGRRLARIYSELDLVAAECLREGVWDGLDPAELACAASLLVYEARSSDDAPPPRVPKGPAREAIERTLRIWSETHNLEADYDLDFQREPDTGFAWAAFRWASGHRLAAVLDEVGLPAGDFVRWCKQLIDLLGQIADAAGADPDSGVRQAAREAVGLIRRGVVAYSSVT
jgi:ATP-dependent RNA helicase HelY